MERLSNQSNPKSSAKRAFVERRTVHVEGPSASVTIPAALFPGPAEFFRIDLQISLRASCIASQTKPASYNARRWNFSCCK